MTVNEFLSFEELDWLKGQPNLPMTLGGCGDAAVVV